MTIKDLKMKRSLRATLMAETLINIYRQENGLPERPFVLETMNDVMIYTYSVIASSSLDIEYTFSEFLEDMDNPKFAETVNEWFSKDAEINGQYQKKKTTKENLAT